MGCTLARLDHFGSFAETSGYIIVLGELKGISF